MGLCMPSGDVPCYIRKSVYYNIISKYVSNLCNNCTKQLDRVLSHVTTNSTTDQCVCVWSVVAFCV